MKRYAALKKNLNSPFFCVCFSSICYMCCIFSFLFLSLPICSCLSLALCIWALSYIIESRIFVLLPSYCCCPPLIELSYVIHPPSCNLPLCLSLYPFLPLKKLLILLSLSSRFLHPSKYCLKNHAASCLPLSFLLPSVLVVPLRLLCLVFYVMRLIPFVLSYALCLLMCCSLMSSFLCISSTIPPLSIEIPCINQLASYSLPVTLTIVVFLCLLSIIIFLPFFKE